MLLLWIFGQECKRPFVKGLWNALPAPAHLLRTTILRSQIKYLLVVNAPKVGKERIGNND